MNILCFVTLYFPFCPQQSTLMAMQQTTHLQESSGPSGGAEQVPFVSARLQQRRNQIRLAAQRAVRTIFHRIPCAIE